MKILRAEHLGMCFGVRDAIAMAKKVSTRESLTILGELVHNTSVLDDLRERGIQIESDLNNVKTPTVMITAHGASDRRMEEVKERGFNVIEATCPLVRFAHRSLSKLVGQGFHPVIIGKSDHAEVKGMTEDLHEFEVVLSDDDVQHLQARARFGVVSQTTQPIEKVQHIVQLIRQRFPKAELRFVDTVCQPTKQRQTAATTLAAKSDVVVVIGGAQSNNTHQLVATCRLHCLRVHHVQGSGDLKREWFQDVDVVGITAGTSTPDHVIDEVECGVQNFSAERTLPLRA